MKNYWNAIEELNWDGNYQRCKEEILKKYSKEDAREFESFVNLLMNDLYKKYEKEWLDKIPASDDGWSDIRAEIIGRGKEFYNNITVEKMIDMAETLDYHESFIYVFPYDYDLEKKELLEKKPTLEESERTLLDKVESIIMTTKGHIDREHTVAAIKAAIKLEFKKLK